MFIGLALSSYIVYVYVQYALKYKAGMLTLLGREKIRDACKLSMTARRLKDEFITRKVLRSQNRKLNNQLGGHISQLLVTSHNKTIASISFGAR